MSISVDDLVASLSGNHIGQEAMDLATLQAQLAQTLFSQEFPHNMHAQNGRPDTDDVQLCNTPTTRTRSSSLSFGQMGDMSMAHRRSSSGASRRSRKNSAVVMDGTWEDVDEMDEDEQMVEDLVTPSSPISPSENTFNFAFSHRKMSSSSSSRPHTASAPNSCCDASLFTTTDPFYIQASQNPQPASSSVFAQSGRPAQHSPFLQQSQNTYVHPVPMSAVYNR